MMAAPSSSIEICAEALDEPRVSNNVRVRELAGKLVAYLSADAIESYSTTTLRHAFGGGVTDPQFGRALGQARERLRRDHRIEYVPSGMPGCFKRATALQSLNRGVTFEATSVRKLKRAGYVYETANVADLSTEERQRLDARKDKNGLRVTQMRQIASIRTPIPMGNDAQPPAAPRRGQGAGS